MPTLSPAYDNKILRKYSARTVEHKLENKTALQEELHWVTEPKQPIVCLPTGITDALGGKLFEQVLPGMLELPIGIIIRGRGSKKYGETLTSIAKVSGHRVAIMPDEDDALRRMLAGSDMAMFFSDEDEDDVLENCLRFGAIPIALPRGVLENYNPVQESGNSFVFEEPTHWQCFAALVRALETFRFPYDWRTIQRHAMETVGRSTELVEMA